MINGGQMTITLHVDDLEISHRDPVEVDAMIDWFKLIYSKDERISRGEQHNYIGMTLEYHHDGTVEIKMID